MVNLSTDLHHVHWNLAGDLTIRWLPADFEMPPRRVVRIQRFDDPLDATLKQWRFTLLWRRAIRECMTASLVADINVDNTAAKSVVVDTTADLWWQPVQR